MSFHWDSCDITAAIGVLDGASGLLHCSADVDPRSPQLTNFLTSLSKTLNGLIKLLKCGTEVEWGDDLVEHANSIQAGIANLKNLMNKHDSSTQIDPNDPKSYPLSENKQLALSHFITYLQDTLSRPQLVLDVFINLQALSTLLEQSRKTTRTVEQLKAETQQVCRMLPSIASDIAGVNNEEPSRFKTLKDVQQYAEFLVRGDLDDTKTSLLELQEIQIPLSQESRIQWQEYLGLTIEWLQTCCSVRLDGLLGRPIDTKPSEFEIQNLLWQKAINSLVQIVDGELAGGMSIAFALESQEEVKKRATENSSQAMASLLQAEPRECKAKTEYLDENAMRLTAVALDLKTVDTKSNLPIQMRNIQQPTTTVKEMGSANSSDKENNYMKMTLSKNQECPIAYSTFSKPTLGSKSIQSSPRVTAFVTKFNKRIFQHRNTSSLSQEIVLQNPNETPRGSMLGPEKYSFALERWVNESDHLEMLLNTGELNEKRNLEILAGSPEDYASAVGQFPRVLLKGMIDWDSACNPMTKKISSMGKVQIAL